jgi:hypothetical protein
MTGIFNAFFHNCEHVTLEGQPWQCQQTEISQHAVIETLSMIRVAVLIIRHLSTPRPLSAFAPWAPLRVVA